jgi:hypothetical protein
MSRAARLGRVRWPLLFAVVCSLSLGTAAALRVDAREVTLRQLDNEQKLQTMSDRQIEDAQRGTERAFMVKKIGGGLVQAPVALLLSAVGLFALSWFLRGRSQSGQVFTVAAYALIPNALGNLVEAAATFLRPSIAPDGPPSVPRDLAGIAAAFGRTLEGPAARLLGSLDVFALWGAILLGFGLSTAAQLPLRRALTGTLIAWLCYRLLRFVAMGG